MKNRMQSYPSGVVDYPGVVPNVTRQGDEAAQPLPLRSNPVQGRKWPSHNDF
jgi:hypothetical protein